MGAESEIKKGIEKRVKTAVNICQTCGIWMQADNQVLCSAGEGQVAHQVQEVDGFDNMKWQPANGKHNNKCGNDL